MSDHVAPADQARITIVIDFGTTKISVGCHIGRPGSVHTAHNTALLQLQRGLEEIPHRLGFVREAGQWKFIWGYQVNDYEAKATRGEILADDLVYFRWLKMCLYPSDRQTEIVDDIRTQLLANGIVGDEHLGEGWTYLFRLLLQSLRDAVMLAIKRQFQVREWSSEQLDLMLQNPVIFIGVPEGSDPTDHVRMMKIVTAAGFPEGVGLFFETEAAGAWSAEKLMRYQIHDAATSVIDNVGSRSSLTAPSRSSERQSDRLGQVAGELLTADGGGMTVNVCVYRAERPLIDGAKMGMEETGRYRGSTNCGSESITLRLVDHILRQFVAQGHLGQRIFRRYGVTREALKVELADEVEHHKNRPEISGFTISIKDHNTPPTRPSIHVEVNADFVRRVLDENIGAIMALLEGVWSSEVKWLVLTGGLFRNNHIRTTLKDTCESRGVVVIDGGNDIDGTRDHSVVRGAILRLSSSTPRPRRNLGLAMAQEMEWWAGNGEEPGSHADVPSSDTTLGGETLVKMGSQGQYVENRWVWLVRPGGCSAAGEAIRPEPIWQMFEIDPKDPYLRKDIYWTDQDIPEPTHIYAAPAGGRLELLDGIHEWNPGWSSRIDDSYIASCQKVRTEDGEKAIVWARLRVVVRGVNIQATWDLAPPHARIRTAAGCAAWSKRKLEALSSISLNNEGYNAFPHRGTGLRAASGSSPTRPLVPESDPMPGPSQRVRTAAQDEVHDDTDLEPVLSPIVNLRTPDHMTTRSRTNPALSANAPVAQMYEPGSTPGYGPIFEEFKPEETENIPPIDDLTDLDWTPVVGPSSYKASGRYKRARVQARPTAQYFGKGKGRQQ